MLKILMKILNPKNKYNICNIPFIQLLFRIFFLLLINFSVFYNGIIFMHLFDYSDIECNAGDLIPCYDLIPLIKLAVSECNNIPGGIINCILGSAIIFSIFCMFFVFLLLILCVYVFCKYICKYILLPHLYDNYLYIHKLYENMVYEIGVEYQKKNNL